MSKPKDEIPKESADSKFLKVVEYFLTTSKSEDRKPERKPKPKKKPAK